MEQEPVGGIARYNRSYWAKHYPMEKDEHGPYHERGQVPEELFVEYEMYFSRCETCGWQSDYAPDRKTAVTDTWGHDYLMTEAGLPDHNIVQMKCLMIIERDNPNEREPELS